MNGRNTGTGKSSVPQVKKLDIFMTGFEVGVLPETLKTLLMNLFQMIGRYNVFGKRII